MQFFTTEMIFMHPPRTFAGHYASPRRRRYGCRTMPLTTPAPRAPDEARAQSSTAHADTAPGAGTDNTPVDLAA